MQRPRLITLLILASALSVGLSPGATAKELWKVALELQLEKEKKCKLVRLSSVQVYELLGERNIRAVAYCLDGRVYTVTQSKRHDKFRFTVCPTLC